MIDAASLSLQVVDPERVAARLDGARHVSGADGFRAVTGYVGSLRASIRADRLRVGGSLPEYLGVEHTLGRAEVERVRERLTEAVGEDVGHASVWRLELSADLVLTLPVAAYLPVFVRRERLQRVEYEGESVAFDAAVRRVVFYDKAAERRKRKRPAPAGNVLRVEVQYRKRLRRQLGTDGPVTLADLHDRAFWAYLVARWVREYEAVDKARAPLPFDALTADARRGVALAGLAHLGRPTVEAAIHAAHARGTLTRSTMYNRLAWVRDLDADPALTCEDDRVRELDAAVRAAADRALSEA